MNISIDIPTAAIFLVIGFIIGKSVGMSWVISNISKKNSTNIIS